MGYFFALNDYLPSLPIKFFSITHTKIHIPIETGDLKSLGILFHASSILALGTLFSPLISREFSFLNHISANVSYSQSIRIYRYLSQNRVISDTLFRIRFKRIVWMASIMINITPTHLLSDSMWNSLDWAHTKQKGPFS